MRSPRQNPAVFAWRCSVELFCFGAYDAYKKEQSVCVVVSWCSACAGVSTLLWATVRQMPAATRNATARSRQCNPTRVRRCLRIFFGHLFSNLGLFALVVGYVLLGALLFEFLEASYELEQRGHIQRYREDCLKELWLITGKTIFLWAVFVTSLVMHADIRRLAAASANVARVPNRDHFKELGSIAIILLEKYVNWKVSGWWSSCFVIFYFLWSWFT